MYLEKFVLPTDENGVYMSYYYENGGYVDNQYPCGIFTKAGLTELDFEKITVLAGSNGSGKSTLLNLIACKLGLDRIAPYNGGELFDRYTRACRYRTGYDDTGVKTRIPIGSAVIASDDVFDHMLTVRSANAEYADDSAFAKGEYGRLFWGDSIRFTGGRFSRLRTVPNASPRPSPLCFEKKIRIARDGRRDKTFQQRGDRSRIFRRKIERRQTLLSGRAREQSFSAKADRIEADTGRKGEILRMSVCDRHAFSVSYGARRREDIRSRCRARRYKKVVGTAEYANILRIFQR